MWQKNTQIKNLRWAENRKMVFGFTSLQTCLFVYDSQTEITSICSFYCIFYNYTMTLAHFASLPRLCGRPFCYYCCSNTVSTQQGGGREHCCVDCYNQHSAVVERHPQEEVAHGVPGTTLSRLLQAGRAVTGIAGEEAWWHTWSHPPVWCHRGAFQQRWWRPCSSCRRRWRKRTGWRGFWHHHRGGSERRFWLRLPRCHRRLLSWTRPAGGGTAVSFSTSACNEQQIWRRLLKLNSSDFFFPQHFVFKIIPDDLWHP